MTGERHLQRHVGKIARWIAASEHTVAFTGAGISTDSGIPDFRGPEGVWTRRDAGLPAPRWRVPPDEVAPNASHLSLFELQRLGKLRFLVTQNTDNLHRRSGISPEVLAELHGNGQLMRCQGCGRLFTRQEVGWDTGRWGPGYRTQKPVPSPPLRPDARPGLLAHGAACGLARRAGAQLRSPGGPGQPGQNTLRQGCDAAGM